MNRAEARQTLKSITVKRTTVHGDELPAGFSLGEAVAALGNFERASRYLSDLTRIGHVNCQRVQIGGTFHDHYSAT